MPRQAVKIKSDKTTDELENAFDEFEVPVPLTLDTWDLPDAISAWGPAKPVVIESADGDLFTATVTAIDDAARTLTVELS